MRYYLLPTACRARDQLGRQEWAAGFHAMATPTFLRSIALAMLLVTCGLSEAEDSVGNTEAAQTRLVSELSTRRAGEKVRQQMTMMEF